jgi:hypothetical protein
MELPDIMAIDPVALILRGKALEIYWLIHHPHVPPIGTLQEALKGATPDERRAMLVRAKVLKEYATAVEAAIEKVQPG